jgi:hypothetical protein
VQQTKPDAQMLYRTTREQMNRIDKAAASCKLTKQAFVHAAIFAEVEAVEHKRQMRLIGDDTVAEVKEIETKTPLEGMGILEALRQRREEETPKPKVIESPTHAPVVVNVGTSPTGTGGNVLIDQLASYVIAGPEFERSQRLRMATSVLHATATTNEARKVLAAQLDAAVATKVKEDTESTVEKFMGGAKFAFNKLSSFLGE